MTFLRGNKMKIKNLVLLALSLAFSCAYCNAENNDKNQIQGVGMHHIEHQKEKFFIGFELRTNNEIWQSGLPRSYTSDFEVYQNDFDPKRNPEVKVCIAIE